MVNPYDIPIIYVVCSSHICDTTQEKEWVSFITPPTLVDTSEQKRVYYSLISDRVDTISLSNGMLLIWLDNENWILDYVSKRIRHN